MNNVLTVPVSERVMRFIAEIATQTKQSYETVLADHLDSTMPVESLSDHDVLSLAESKFPQAQDDRLSELLALQRESQLTETTRQELNELMRLYEEGSVRKAQALRVAVERGLYEPSGTHDCRQ